VLQVLSHSIAELYTLILKRYTLHAIQFTGYSCWGLISALAQDEEFSFSRARECMPERTKQRSRQDGKELKFRTAHRGWQGNVNLNSYTLFHKYGLLTRPNRPWDPPSPLYNEYRLIPRAKAAGSWR
jgi:hypothetical protein